MEAVFLIEHLQKKIGFLNHAVSQRNQLPILSNFLIKAGDGKLTFYSTDLEIGMISSIPASIKKEGETTVPAKTFSDLVSNITKGKVEVKLTEKGLELKGDRVKTVFQIMPCDEFPRLFEKKGELVAEFSKELLDKEFSKVIFAASQDTGRPALSGVLAKKGAKGTDIVSTDGYRLSINTNLSMSVKGKESEQELLIPARVIKEALLLKEEGNNLKMYVSLESSQVVFVLGETTLVGRLIAAEYPSYEKIIPSDFSTKSEFLREDMLSAVRICSVFARETANIVKFSVNRDKIIVSATTPSVGENSAEVEAKTEGEENEIAFNARYLLEMLTNIDEETLIFEMTGPLNPGVFKIKGDSSFLHLIMPIRVS